MQFVLCINSRCHVKILNYAMTIIRVRVSVNLTVLQPWDDVKNAEELLLREGDPRRHRQAFGDSFLASAIVRRETDFL